MKRGERRVESIAFTAHEQAVGALNPIPALVPVHGVIAANDAGDTADAGRFAGRLEGLEEPHSRLRRRVPPVRDRVHQHLVPPESLVGRHLQERPEVVVAGMDHPGAQQPKKVERLAPGSDVGHQLPEGRIARELSVLDGLVDPADVLVDDPPCTEVGVPDLAVAHDSQREAHL